MFQLIKQRKRSSVEVEVINTLASTNRLLSEYLIELKELEVAAATDRKDVLNELRKISQALDELTK